MTKVFDLRGYLLLALMLVLSIAQSQPAYLEVVLLLFIIAVSKDGSFLLGSVATQVARIPGLQSTFGKAVLMAIPVKTLTAMFGTSTQQEFADVTFSATVALVFLGLALGLFASWLLGREVQATAGSQKAPRWVTAADMGLLLFLLLLGDDGPALFGSLATSLHEHTPFLRDASVRGVLAIIPVKTVTTLFFASPNERGRIAAHGAPIMGVLAVLTFIAFWSSSVVPVYAALPIGVVAAVASTISLNSFKRVVREEAAAA